MKVTARITADGLGERWGAEFPRLDAARCFPTINGKPTADANECYLALAKSSYIQGVKRDEAYLNQIVASWVKMVDGWKDDNCISEESDGYARTMKRIEHRTDRQQQTFVRAVWHEHKGVGISLSITVGNDGKVAQKRDYERFFAWKMAEAAVILNEDLAERGLPLIELDAGTRELVDELKAWCAEREAERELKKKNEERFFCPHHCKGFCTTDKDGNPPDFGCPCYSRGQCVEATAIKAKDDKEVK